MVDTKVNEIKINEVDINEVEWFIDPSNLRMSIGV